MFGKEPFAMKDGALALTLQPILPAYLIPEDGKVEASFLGNISVSYQFAAKKDYIPGEYTVEKIVVTYKDGRTVESNGCVTGADAEAIRDGLAESIVVESK